MRVVLSHQEFSGFGGTETYVLTVAQSLQRLGHEPLIFARATGDMADFARGNGVQVVADEGALPDRCDAVLAQDADTACTMAVTYPDATRVFVCHSAEYLLQQPPLLPGPCQAVVAMNDRVAQHLAGLAWVPPIVRMRQPIDLDRFRLSGVTDSRPKRALVLSNYVRGPRWEMIEHACGDAGVEVALAGVDGRPTPTPEHEMAQAQVVIGLGRGVLEAMAAGRAAYVFGPAGGDGWVTPGNYAELESDGFSGRAGARVIDRAALAGDLDAWEPGMGECNRDLASAHHDAERHAVRLVELIGELGAPATVEPAAALEMARLSRLNHEAEGRAMRAEREAARVREDAERLREEARSAHLYAQDVHARWDEARERYHRSDARIEEAEEARRRAEERVEAALSARRVRLAYRLTAPLDRLRGRGPAA